MTIENSQRGKRARKNGKDFEKKVQADLEKDKWIVSRWPKKIENGVLIDSRPKYNPYTKSFMALQTGFPDFLIIREDLKEVMLVECKVRGYLDKEEREQVDMYKKIGFEVIIAYKDENDKIQYKQALGNS